MADINPAMQAKAARLANELPEHDSKKPAKAPAEKTPDHSLVSILWALSTTARDARGSSPVYDPSNPAPFQSYWYNTFTHLACTVATRAPLPHDKIDIKLYDEPLSHSMLPPSAPAIRLSREGGVREGDLVKGLRDYLYGERQGKVLADYSRRAEEFQAEDLGVVLWDHSYSDWDDSDPPVMIFYCCPVDRWDDMLTQQEEERIKLAEEMDMMTDEEEED